MPKSRTVSLRTRWLGESLRAERNKAGYTLQAAADYVGIDLTSLGRFERGTHRIRKSYLRDLINFYGISNKHTRDRLLRINEDSWRRDWWDGDASDLETGFVDYAWLESRAAKVCHFETVLIPGLLQTREYARAVMELANTYETTADDIDRLLELRTKRQEAIQGDDPTSLSVVLEEAVLRRAIGGSSVAKSQLTYLLEASKLDHVELRVRRLNTTWQPALGSPFTYFDMQDPYPDIAYVENMAGRTFLEESSKVEQFRRAYDDLRESALSNQASARYIEATLKEIE